MQGSASDPPRNRRLQGCQACLEESKRFLDAYYTEDYDPGFVAGWTTAGSIDACVARLRQYAEIGFDEVTLRITSWDQRGQLRRLIDELIPALVRAGVATSSPAAARKPG